MTTDRTFSPSVIGHLVGITTLKTPVQRSRRVRILSGRMNPNGEFETATFLLGGRTYKFVRGVVSLNNTVTLRGMTLHINATWLTEDRIRRNAEWASNPKSETYWSS